MLPLREENESFAQDLIQLAGFSLGVLFFDTVPRKHIR